MSGRKGILILRLGLSFVMLWFGFSQLFDGINWVIFVPDWVAGLIPLPPAMIVLANGLFEVILGTLLAVDLWVPFSAFALAFHLGLIALSMGLTPTGVRDFGLTTSLMALGFLSLKE